MAASGEDANQRLSPERQPDDVDYNMDSDTNVIGGQQSDATNGAVEQQTPETGGRHRHVQLPLNRVRMMIKSDPDVSIVGQEALMVIAKATEMFIAYVARESYTQTLQGKRKTIQKRDFDACISPRDELAFLEGTND